MAKSNQYLIFVPLVVLVVAAFSVLIFIVAPSRDAAFRNKLLGEWTFADRYGRTVFLEFYDDGTMKCYASDDLTDIDTYNWSIKDEIVTVGMPTSFQTQIVKAIFAVRGHPVEDDRTQFSFSEIGDGKFHLVRALDGKPAVKTEK